VTALRHSRVSGNLGSMGSVLLDPAFARVTSGALNIVEWP